MMALAIALALGALAGGAIVVALAREDYERRRDERREIEPLTYEQWRQLRFEGMAETVAAFAAVAFTVTMTVDRFAAVLAEHERRLREARE